MKRTSLLTSAASVITVGVIVAGQTNSSQPAGGDWPMYSLNHAGTRFSPLTEVNAANVARLAPAWSVRLVPPAGGQGAPAQAASPPRCGEDPYGGACSNPEATPIVVSGVMYVPASGNQVLALDADTGKEVWRYRMPQGVTTTARGVAHWPGDGSIAPRILVAAGARLVALDAATGRPATGFGREGMVEILVPWNGVPVIYRNVVILGATTGEVPLGFPGDTRAFDVRTGAKLWQFHTVPLPGELGHDSWLDDGWRGRSGANVWAWYMTIDEERGILYMPIAGPAANYWGGDRPGNNLFANSIVAVDAETGKYRWHFQTVHHDIWDSDMPSPPVLVDIVQNGRKVPALASIGKTGYMFLLDRVTGKPVFGVEERAVPKGNAPGE